MSFFDELSSVFDAVATYQEAVYVAGDVNIRLERCVDPVTKQFTDLLACYGFFVQPTTSAYQAGGTVDAVASVSRLKVSVVDVGLSDHHLLTWSLPALKSPPSVQTMSRRCWRQLDTEQLREQLLASPLCQPSEWPEAIDDMAAMYDSELTAILDRLIPYRTISRRLRPSDAWFDSECRDAKRLTRRLECAYSAACRHAARNDNAGSAGVDAAMVT